MEIVTFKKYFQNIIQKNMIETKMNDPNEIEKEMDNYKVITLADILRALKDNPQWMMEIRKTILTSELMELPKSFENFLRNEFTPLKERVEETLGNIETVKQDVDLLKGDVLEIKLRQNIGGVLGKLFRKVRVIDGNDLADIVYDAVDRGIISEKDADDARIADVVATGYLRVEEGKKIIMAVDISSDGDVNHLERTAKRAKILSMAFSEECIGVFVGRDYTEDTKKRAEELKVILI